MKSKDNSKEMLYEEKVFLHHCFNATQDEIQDFLRPYEHKRIRAGKIGLEQVQRKGNVSIWWYLDSSSLGLGEDKPFLSKIEIQPLNDPNGKPTEVKITFSNHPLLMIFFDKLAENLWRTYNDVSDCKLRLPVTGKPIYKSLVESLIERDKAIREFERAFPEGEEDISHYAETTPKLSPSHYLPKMVETKSRWKKAFDIILDRRDKYHEEYLDNKKEKKRPTIKDFQDAIANDMNWHVGEKTVRNIIKVGDAGMLE